MISGTMCFLKGYEHTLFIYRNRGKNDIHQGYYVPPGGHLERGERSIDNILREFREETGLILLDPRLRAIVTFYNKGRILGGQKDPEDWRVDVYDAHSFKGKWKKEDKRDKLVWIENSKIPRLKMYDGDKKLFELLEQQGVFEVIIKYSKEKLAKFDWKRVN
jgi:8-oxo-dGTP diphosphatase